MQLAINNSNLHSRYQEASTDVFSFCLPHQLVFLNLLAVSQHYDVALGPLLVGLSEETPYVFRQRTKSIAAEVAAGTSAVDAIVNSQLLPHTTNMALRLAKESGTLDEFCISVLNRNQDHSSNTHIAANPFFRLFRLFILTLVVLMLLSFVTIKIIPEFRAMLEEFGIEEPGVFQTFISVSDTFVSFWFVLPALFLLTAPFYLPALLRGVKYINPLNWRKPFGDPLNNLRRATAVAAESGVALPSAMNVVLEGQRGKPKFNLLSNAIADIPNHQTPLQSLAERKIVSAREADSLDSVSSGETQAWLLRWSNSIAQRRHSNRSVYILQVLVTVTHLVVAVIVLLTALTVFSTLVQIITLLNR